MKKAIVRYESIEIPAQETRVVRPTARMLVMLANDVKTYTPLTLQHSEGPFHCTVKLGEKTVGGSFTGREYDLTHVGELRPQEVVEIEVKNTSDEPRKFDAVVTALLSFKVETSASDDGFESLGIHPIHAVPPRERAAPVADEVAEEFFAAEVGGMPIPEPDVFRGIFQRRMASILDNVLRAVDVVVQDAADKLQGPAPMPFELPRPTPQARKLLLGFTSEEPIASGAAASVTSRPQILFGTRKIIIPHEIAERFEIVDFKIGKMSQFSDGHPVPGVTFSSDKGGEEVTFDTAQVSQDVTFVVRNLSNEPTVFKATAVGVTVDDVSVNYAAEAGRRAGSIAAAARRAAAELRRNLWS